MVGLHNLTKGRALLRGRHGIGWMVVGWLVVVGTIGAALWIGFQLGKVLPM
jgi:hypothetical protein